MLQYDEQGNIFEDGQLPVDRAPVQITVNPSKPEWVDSIPAPLTNPDASPADLAAFRLARAVNRKEKLPVQDQRGHPFGPINPEAPGYLVEPDLQETQGGMHLPSNMYQDAGGGIFFNGSNEQVPIAKRPGLLPVTMTPEGLKFVMPRMADIVGNVMGNVGGKVMAKPGEMVLGSGMVKTTEDALKAASDPFYSALERAVNSAKVDKATPEQWLGYLRNQPGVKAEELNTVLKELPEGQITKPQLEELVKQNKVELKEKVLGDPKEIARMTPDSPSFDPDKIQQANPTKYHSYQLPGGENYKEMLLSLLVKNEKRLAEIKTRLDEISNLPAKETDHMTAKGQKYLEEWDNLRLEQGKLRNEVGEQFKSSHWDEPNVLAHIRMNDRYLDDPGYVVRNLKSGNKSEAFRTKEEAEVYQAKLIGRLASPTEIVSAPYPHKSLHLEELQSDWHQKGRKEGYKLSESQKKDLNSIDEKLMKGLSEKEIGSPDMEAVLKTAVDKKVLTAEEARNYKDYSKGENSTIPDAPFKRNWDELALKRMIHKAASEGYEGISWTPGEAQAARYDLSKHIDKLSYNPKQNYLKAWDKNGKEVMAKGDIKPEDLAEHIGKEAAEKVMGQKPKDYAYISDVTKDDLKIVDAEYQYIVNAKDGRQVPIGKGTVGSKKEALEYAERYFNKSAKDINQQREIEFGRLGPTHILQGADLKIGGEGMKAFYDKMLVDKANNLIKKYGSKVEQREIPVGPQHKSLAHFLDWAEAQYPSKYSRSQLGEFWKHGEQIPIVKEFVNSSKQQPIHYFPITKELRDKATKEGFPLFSSSPVIVPVDHTPEFEDKKKVKLVPVEGDPFK